jgi:hypothetical protein
MSNRSHDRSYFFKYASFKTAKRVIESKSFRWSSPAKFNDPFDDQVSFVLDSDPAEFAEHLTASIERIIFSEVAPPVRPTSLFAELTLQMRSIRDKLPRETVLEELHEDSVQAAANLHSHIGDFNAAIQEQLCHSRVFCVSECHDNVLMWSHYADEHRGVVFKLRCMDEIDNPLLAARRVSYRDTFMAFPSAEQYALHLTGEKPIDFGALCWDIAFIKHTDWSYEREWRVHVALLNEPPGDGYTVYSVDPRVFEAVYLGCQMEDEAVVEIVDLVRRHLPDTKILRGTKSATAFELSFHEI